MSKKQSFKSLETLWKTIENRASNASPDDSYVAYLLSRGIKECSKKLGEEAIEASLAATSLDKKETIKESADVLFHIFVLWKALNIEPNKIMEELKKREFLSGHEEKRRRKK